MPVEKKIIKKPKISEKERIRRIIKFNQRIGDEITRTRRAEKTRIFSIT